MSEKLFQFGVDQKLRSGKEIVFTDFFADYVRAHPGFMSNAKKGVDAASTEEAYVANDIKVEKIRESRDGASDFPRSCFRVRQFDTDGNTDGDFFVKLNFAESEHERGTDEVLLMQKVSNLLELLRVRLTVGVRVVNYSVGYRDKYKCYYVSEWEDGLQKNLRDYLEELEDKIASGHDGSALQAQCDRLKDQARIIKEFFASEHIRDVEEYNMSYDEKCDEITLFDFRKEE